MPRPFVEDAAVVLARELPAQAFVLELVRFLDLRFDGNAPTSLEHQMLARAVVAVGTLFEGATAIDRTLGDARAFVAEPSAGNYDELQRTATDSYPFGPGDGCLAVAELGYDGCVRGSGCRSGAGCLASMALEVGFDQAARAIRAQLTPWLAALTPR